MNQTAQSARIWIKMLGGVAENRPRECVNISDEHFALMRSQPTVDAIFALRQLQEKYHEAQSNLRAIFIDLEKVYDWMPREELYWCMRQKLVPEKCIRVVRDTHIHIRTYVYTRVKPLCDVQLEPQRQFPVKVQPHQGSALSPFLFAIIMDCLTEEVRERTHGRWCLPMMLSCVLTA